MSRAAEVREERRALQRRRTELRARLETAGGQERQALRLELAGVEEGKRAAKFVSAVCFYLPEGRSVTYLGE